MQISVVLDKAIGTAKELLINNISLVMIAGKFKIMRSGPKTVTVEDFYPWWAQPAPSEK